MPNAREVSPQFAAEQLSQANETLRLIASLYIQITAAAIAGNVLLIAYAGSQRQAGLFLLSAVLPLIVVLFSLVVQRLGLAAAYAILMIEDEHALGHQGFVSNFYGIAHSPSFVSELRAVTEISSVEERFRALRHIPGPLFGTGRGLLRATMGLIFIVDVVTPFALWVLADWKLFG